MTAMTVAIGSDHAGYALKGALAEELRAMDYDVLDMGAHSEDSVDYPDFGRAVAAAIADGRAARGVVVCGSGVGISIAANRNPAVRCVLAADGLTARLAREHNDANVLALGSRLVGIETARDALRQFLDTPFAGGRHAARVAKLGQEISA